MVPIRSFTKQNRTITIYGMIHLAPQQFWDDLTIELNKHLSDGTTTIHREGTNLSDAPARWKLPAWVASAAQRMPSSYITNQYPTLVPQKRGLAPLLNHPAVHRVDLPQADLLRGFSLRDWIRFVLTTALSFLLRMSPKTQANVAQRSLRNAMHHVRAVSAGDPDTNSHPVLHVARDQHAITEATREPGDVILLWGAGHLPGMTGLLNADGWETTNTRHLRWGTVCLDCERRP